MKATNLTLGLVGVLLVASAEGCSGSSAGGDASDGGGSGSGGSSGSSSGGADGSSGGADTSYCIFERSGVSRCAGWADLGTTACDAVHGAVVSSCPTSGMVGCCTVWPSYKECWYCPADPSQLQSACQTLAGSQWTAGETCGSGGSSGSSSGGSSGADGGADAGFYDTTCSSSSLTCPNTPLICQKFSFGGGAINGYACTQTCSSTSDCLAPGDPAVQCLPFTTAHFCVITCDATSTTNTCPGSAQCVADPGNVGICVRP
jgi:hypothetical protein